MTAAQWIGLAGGALVASVIAFAFRQGTKVKPDPNRKTEDWPRITQGGTGS
jgi:hypothetical protein